jgi:choline dehydrogenase-like flavoprotein
VSPAALSPRQRVALDAICRRTVPAAYRGGAVALAAWVEERLTSGDVALLRDARRALELFDHPVTAALAGALPRRFAALSPEAQDARLSAWIWSRVPVRRTIAQALRRLILTTWYARPEAQHALGYLGPLFEREPSLPWEGPLDGAPDESEPVARGSRAGATDAPAAGRVPAGVTRGAEVRDGAVLRADVCVIGTGAGGAVAAARLAEAGREVILLEEGGYYAGADFDERERDMVPALYADAGARATTDLSVSLFQGCAVGGSTTINWMIMLRTPDEVLDEWAREHGTQGMRGADLAPIFDQIEAETHTRVVPDDAHSPSNRIILDGARRLGWSARPAAINARDCVRAGFCGLGCRYGAKQSTLVTYVPRALAAGARLVTNARVERVAVVERGGTSPRKRVEATVRGRDGGRPHARLVVEAPVVVLAAGAVGTPAILQRSGMGGGGVGRYLRLHPTTVSLGEYDRTIYGAAGIPLSAVCDEFLQPGAYGFWIECPPLHPALASAALPGFGARHRAMMERFRGLGALIVLVRDGADRGVSQGEVTAGRSGRVRIRYRLGAHERLRMIEGLQAGARLHLAAGAREVRTLHERECVVRAEHELARIAAASYAPNDLAVFSAHVNGTCRLGTDPRTSGCTGDGERHGVRGLYVADGSLLPTAPGVNPQETIMALATVVAGRIAERHPAPA